MNKLTLNQSRAIVGAAVLALVFGLLTIYSGGFVLFVDGPARVAAGAYVPFVLWFNFLAGFVYILTGIGLYLWRGWAVALAMLLAIATLLAFAAFGWHIFSGGSYEPRTIGAMSLRSIVWLTIAFLARSFWNKQRSA